MLLTPLERASSPLTTWFDEQPIERTAAVANEISLFCHVWVGIAHQLDDEITAAGGRHGKGSLQVEILARQDVNFRKLACISLEKQPWDQLALELLQG
jgi:hypothetical protein